jgi:hypothetical protein
MEMKPGWFLCKKVFQHTIGLVLFRRKGKEIDGHG